MASSIKKSDIKVGPNLYRSMQSKYNKRHADYCERAMSLLCDAIPFYTQHLDVPEDLMFRLGSLKGNVKGYYNHAEKLVTVDYVAYTNNLLESLAHEMVHAEQYHQGRLESAYSTVKGWYWVWNGQSVNRATTYAAYRALPHEEEAFRRAPILAQMFKDYHSR